MIKWILVSIVIFVGGIFMLGGAADLFISELTQEVAVENESTESPGVKIGEQAPYFELSDLSGKNIRLSELIGAPFILTFWTSWNMRAADQLALLDEFVRTHENTNIRFFAVNSQEDKSVVSSLMLRGGYTMPVLLDEKGKVSEQYKARNLPTTYFIDSKGIVREVFVADILDAEAFREKSAILR